MRMPYVESHEAQALRAYVDLSHVMLRLKHEGVSDEAMRDAIKRAMKEAGL